MKSMNLVRSFDSFMQSLFNVDINFATLPILVWLLVGCQQQSDPKQRFASGPQNFRSSEFKELIETIPVNQKETAAMLKMRPSEVANFAAYFLGDEAYTIDGLTFEGLASKADELAPIFEQLDSEYSTLGEIMNRQAQVKDADWSSFIATSHDLMFGEGIWLKTRNLLIGKEFSLMGSISGSKDRGSQSSTGDQSLRLLENGETLPYVLITDEDCNAAREVEATVSNDLPDGYLCGTRPQFAPGEKEGESGRALEACTLGNLAALIGAATLNQVSNACQGNQFGSTSTPVEND